MSRTGQARPGDHASLDFQVAKVSGIDISVQELPSAASNVSGNGSGFLLAADLGPYLFMARPLCLLAVMLLVIARYR